MDISALLAKSPFAAAAARGAALVVGAGEPARVVFATPAALATFGARDIAALDAALFGADSPGARRLRQLMRALPVGAPPRLESLRFFARGVAIPVGWLCAQIVGADERGSARRRGAGASAEAASPAPVEATPAPVPTATAPGRRRSRRRRSTGRCVSSGAATAKTDSALPTRRSRRGSGRTRRARARRPIRYSRESDSIRRIASAPPSRRGAPSPGCAWNGRSLAPSARAWRCCRARRSSIAITASPGSADLEFSPARASRSAPPPRRRRARRLRRD